MTQSRGMSALEAIVNAVVGWLVAFATQLALFPAVGLQATPAQHLVLSLAFTAVSVARGYLLRRAFARFG
jgi:hypothetical protein